MRNHVEKSQSFEVVELSARGVWTSYIIIIWTSVDWKSFLGLTFSIAWVRPVEESLVTFLLLKGVVIYVNIQCELALKQGRLGQFHAKQLVEMITCKLCLNISMQKSNLLIERVLCGGMWKCGKGFVQREDYPWAKPPIIERTVNTNYLWRFVPDRRHTRTCPGVVGENSMTNQIRGNEGHGQRY